MKTFLPALAVLAVPLSLFGQAPRPPQAPPLAFGITVGGQGLGVDVGSKTVSVPPDWKVVVQAPAKVKAAALPPAAPPVVGWSGSISYAEAWELAKTGQPVTIFVGVSPKQVAGPWASTYYLEGVSPGTYTTRLEADGPKLVLVTPAYTAAGVAVASPFGVASPSTRLTYAPPAAGVSTSRNVGWELTRTRTVAGPTVLSGGITTVNGPFGGGCANGSCGAPQRTGILGLFR